MCIESQAIIYYIICELFAPITKDKYLRPYIFLIHTFLIVTGTLQIRKIKSKLYIMIIIELIEHNTTFINFRERYTENMHFRTPKYKHK